MNELEEKITQNILLLQLTIQKNENSRSLAPDTPQTLSKIAIVTEIEGLHGSLSFLSENSANLFIFPFYSILIESYTNTLRKDDVYGTIPRLENGLCVQTTIHPSDHPSEPKADYHRVFKCIVKSDRSRSQRIDNMHFVYCCT